jgi:hypothetical protein
MARAYHMSWDGPRGRWVKMYKGQRFTVACSVLGVPATKEGSYQAANAWWAKKKAEIDAARQPVPRPPLPMEELLRAWLPQDIYDDYQKARDYAGYLSPEQERQAVEEIANRHRAMGIKVEVRPHTERGESEEEKQQVLAEAHERAASNTCSEISHSRRDSPRSSRPASCLGSRRR